MGVQIEQATIALLPRGPQGPPGTPGAPGDQVSFATTTDAAAATIDGDQDYVRTAGFDEVGLGSALYVRRASEPSHPGKFQNSEDSSWWEIAEPVLYAEQFGVKADGATDDTLALANALYAARVTGRRLYLPGTDIKVTSGFTISGPTALVGTFCGGTTAGPSSGSTKIKPTGPMTVFTVSTPYGCTFDGVCIEFPAATPSTAGCTGIALTDGTTYNSGSRITGCHFAYCDTAVNTIKAASFVVSFNIGYSCNIGVIVNNAYHGDFGDSEIIGNTFTMASGLPNIFGIYQLSSGGLKVIGNKIAGGAYSYVLALTSTASTGILTFTGNSLEGMYQGAMLFTRADSHSFLDVVIAGNQINQPSQATGPAHTIYVPADASGTWLTSMVITGNAIYGPSQASSSCINIDKIQGVTITGNTFRSNHSSNIAVIAGTDATNGVVGNNAYIGTFAANSIGNASFVDNDTKSYTVATLPLAEAGRSVFASDLRVFDGDGTQEGGGSGTGGMVTYNGSAWKIAGTNITAVA